MEFTLEPHCYYHLMLPRVASARDDFQSGREKQRTQLALLEHITVKKQHTITGQENIP